jgi:hypothetical protein
MSSGGLVMELVQNIETYREGNDFFEKLRDNSENFHKKNTIIDTIHIIDEQSEIKKSIIYDNISYSNLISENIPIKERLKYEFNENLIIIKNLPKGWDGEKSKPYKKYMIDMVESFITQLEKSNFLYLFEEIRPFPVYENEIQINGLLNNEKYQIEANFLFYDNSIDCYLFDVTTNEDIETLDISMENTMEEIIKTIGKKVTEYIK